MTSFISAAAAIIFSFASISAATLDLGKGAVPVVATIVAAAATTPQA